MSALTKERTTTRMVLRALTYHDAPAAFSGWTSDPAVAHFMPWPLHTSLRDTQDWLAVEVAKVQSLNTFNWGMVEKSSGQLIGTVGINVDGCTCELGYCLSQAHWGKGYVPEAIASVLAFAASNLHLASVFARVANENVQSVRVLEKLNFHHVGACTYSSYDETRIFPSQEYIRHLTIAPPPLPSL